MSDISKIKVNNTTYTLKDSRIPEMPNDSSKVLKGNGTWGTVSSPYVSGTGTGSAVLYSSDNAKASGNYSVSDGRFTEAIGLGSHAEGVQSMAIGTYSHAEGGSSSYTSLSGVTSVAGNTKKYTVSSTAAELNYYMIGSFVNYGNSIKTYITDVNPTEKTIEVAESLGDLQNATVTRVYNNASVGEGSHAEGCDTSAYGPRSHAEGYRTFASHVYAHAEGNQTRTDADYAHSEGSNTVANGSASHSEGDATKTTGSYSHAEGSSTETIGSSSHSEGYKTIAKGSQSHSEGDRTVAYGKYSHAEGGTDGSKYVTVVLTGSGNTYTSTTSVHYRYLGRTITYNDTSSVITNVDPIINQIKVDANNSLGTLNGASCKIVKCSISYGNSAHAEGSDCGATSSYSHAEGYSTSTKGTYSHSEGYLSVAYGDSSHAEGNSITSYGKYSHAEGGPGNPTRIGVRFTGSGTTYTAAVSEEIRHIYLGCVISYNDTSALITYVNTINREIHVDRTLGEFDTSTLFYITTRSMSYGDNSHIEGGGCRSIGIGSHAEGLDTASVAQYSHSEGCSAVAYNSFSHAEGYEAISAGIYSHAEGCFTYTAGSSSHAEGGVSGPEKRSVVLTGSSTSYTYVSTATISDNLIGQPISYGSRETFISSIDTVNKTMTLYASLGTLDSATCIVAIYTAASGTSAHAEGSKCSASGDYSHAEGYESIAIGARSHAEGCACVTRASYAHAEGWHTVAKAEASHAEGAYTIATAAYSHAAGKYNVEDLNNTYAEIIGIGTSNSSRKNGRTLDWSGNEKLAGSLTLGLGTTNETTITAAQLKQLLTLLS